MVTDSIEKLAYSLEETAKAIGLHVNSVRALVAAGKLPAIRPGGRKILVSKKELEKWLAGQSNQPPAAGSTP